jgi:hypothetical protein
MTATEVASARASRRVASPEIADVRMAVMLDASAMASSLTNSASNSSTTPIGESYGVASLPGKMVMTFAPSDAAAPRPPMAGMDTKASGESCRRSTVRSGSSALPAASVASASAMTSIHAGIGSRACTSASIRRRVGLGRR